MTATTPYLDTIYQDISNNIRQSLLTAVDKQPDTEAKLQALAKQYQLPVDAVRLEQPTLERRARLDAVDYESLVKDYPHTGALLADPEKAAIAHDDIGNLSALEAALHFGKNVGKSLLSGVYGFAEGVAGQGEAGADLLSKYVTGPIADAGILPVDIGGPVAKAFHDIRRSQTAIREALTPKEGGPVEQGVYSGLQSLTQNLLTLPLALGTDNPGLALQTMSLNTGGQSYGKARDAGADPARSALYGAADAAIEYGTELAPVSLLFQDLKAGSSFFKTLTNQLATEIPGEQAATVLQDLNEWAVVHPEKTLADYAAERPDAALQTLVATAVGSGGQVGLIHAVNALANRNLAQQDAANHVADQLDMVSQLAAASKVLGRDPASVSEFVQGIAEADGNENLYIDAKAFAQTGIAEQVAALLPGVAEQLPTALATGGEVRIPVADYVELVGKQPAFAQTLNEHLRLEGEEFSRAGATAYMAEHGQALQREMEQVLKGRERDTAFQQGVEAVKAAVQGQLDALGRFRPEVTERYAALHGAYYGVMAGKLGLTPEQLFEKYPVNINSYPHNADDFIIRNASGHTDSLDQNPNSNNLYHQIQDGDQNNSFEAQYFHLDGLPKPAAMLLPNKWGDLEQDAGGRTYPGGLGGNQRPSPVSETGEPLGQFEPNSRTITLLPKANLSTFLHESAHLFLETQFDITAQLLKQQSSVSSETAQFFNQSEKPPVNPGKSKVRLQPNDYSLAYIDNLTNNELPPGLYATKTRFMVAQTRLLGTNRVKTPAQAAQAFAYLAQSPIERLEALVTDEKGKPLAIIGALKGNYKSVPYYPETVAAEAFRVKGAAHIWFAHNHPGGQNKFSPGDRTANEKLTTTFWGSKITMHGLLAIAGATQEGRHWVYAHPAVEPYKEESNVLLSLTDLRGKTRAPKATLAVPVLELEFASEAALGPKIPDPLIPAQVIALAGGQTGIILADYGSNPTAFMPITNNRAKQLRTEDGFLDNLHRVLSMSNAGYAIIVNNGEMSEEAIRNLIGFFGNYGRFIMDIIDVKPDGTIISRQQAGIQYRPEPRFFQSAQRSDNIADHVSGDSSQVPQLYPTATGPQQIIADSYALLHWFGLKSLEEWQSLDFAAKTRYHEQFADSFEAYLFEGHAPTPALQSLFARFKAWLLKVYQSIRDLRAHLNDEVRGVFNRMLASAADIKQAEAARHMQATFNSAEQAGMTPTEFADYQALAQQASDTATQILQQQVLQDMQWLSTAQNQTLGALQHQNQDLRSQKQAQIARMVHDQTNYQVWDYLTRPQSGAKLDNAALQKMDLPALLMQHLLDLGMVSKNGGVHPDELAESFGYSSGDQLLQALVTAEPPEVAIQQLTDAALLHAHGQLPNRAARKRAADSAAHSVDRGQFIEKEANILATLAGIPPWLTDSAAEFATSLIQRQNLGDIQPQQYAKAETLAAKKAALAVEQGHNLGAAMAKSQQLLNFYLTKAAYAAQDEVNAGLRILHDNAALFNDVPKPYLEQIAALLERFGLGQNGLGQIAVSDAQPLEPLAKFLRSLHKQGQMVELPSLWQADNFKLSYKKLTLPQFQQLLQAIQQLAYLGRTKQQLLSPVLPEFVPNMLELALQHIQSLPSVANLAATGLAKHSAEFPAKSTYAIALPPSGWLLADCGPLAEPFQQAAKHCQHQQNLAYTAIAERLSAILEPIYKLGYFAGKGQYFPSIGRSFNREMRLVLALYTGNSGSLRYLLAGEGWSLSQINPLLETLTTEEWLAVQQIWDVFGGLRADIAVKHQLITGTEAIWLKPKVFKVSTQTSTGEPIQLFLRGGYYPLEFAPSATNLVDSRKQSALDTAELSRRSYFQTSAEQAFHQPLLYSLAGAYAGAQQIIHDLSWQPWLLDVRKLLAKRAYTQAMHQHYGPQANSMATSQLIALAQDNTAAVKAAEIALHGFRAQLRPSSLGFKLGLAAMQSMDFKSASRRIAANRLGQGMTQMLSNLAEVVEFVSAKSALFQIRSKAGKLADSTDRTAQAFNVKNTAEFLQQIQQLLLSWLWLAAYQQALAEGQIESQAVTHADSQIVQLPIVDHLPLASQLQSDYLAFCELLKSTLEPGQQLSSIEYVTRFISPLLMAYEMSARMELLEADDWQLTTDKLLTEDVGDLLSLFVIFREFWSGVNFNDFSAFARASAGLN